MEAVEVDAVPEARDTSHAACTERVAPRGDAGAIDARLCCRSAPDNASARGAARASSEKQGESGKFKRVANGSWRFYWWTEKIWPL